MNFDRTDEVVDFAQVFKSKYFLFFNIANEYASITDLLITEISSVIEDSNNIEINELENLKYRAEQYRIGKLKIYNSLSKFIVNIFKHLSFIKGNDRRDFLMNIDDMLKSFRTIVDYRCEGTVTILSEYEEYNNIWIDSNDILMMEMNAKFEFLHNLRKELVQKIIDSSEDDKMALIYKISLKYNGWFKEYSKGCSKSFGLKLSLVNHYTKFLENMIKIGSYANRVLVETSNGNWTICSEFIKSLMRDDRIKEEKKVRWCDLSSSMARLFSTMD